nr:Transposase, Tc1-like protein [Ipomoea batatas]GME17943.1 Transposase, Tc1-like protein [Ipomoea batatas]GME18569.1 Transposase, Tc1-like protein [Ipomoea batatas]
MTTFDSIEEKGKVRHGAIRDVASIYSVSTRTVSRIWKKGIDCVKHGVPVDTSLNLTGNVGRKRIQISPDEVSRIPLNRRTTIRSMATALNMSKTSLHRRVKEGSLKSHSNAIKPLLTEENRKVRLQLCISMIDSNSPPHNPSFIDMYDRVHIDEKWFFLSKSSQKYYLLPDEDEPYRTCKSKKFIAKVMFLCAVARPRFDSGRNEMFDGKIGIFPFIYKEAAKRRSKNREAGTLVTKPIESVNKEVTRKWLIDYVLPAIRAKWPLSSSKSIFIQQDNARPHISVNDAEFLEAAQKDGFDIRLTCQPPNSPNMNVLDLGFFRAIQSLQYQEAPRNVDELVVATQKAFDDISIESLSNVFLTLQLCMVEVMKRFGGNNYKIPHINKQKLEREGRLPTTISCDMEVLNEAISSLQH